MILKGGQSEAFLKNPTPGINLALLYGPDAGQVEERATQLIKSVLPNLSDPFRLTEFDGSNLASDPGSLSAEAAIWVLTGGRRIIRVRGARDNAASALNIFLQAASKRQTPDLKRDDLQATEETLVIVEAGELSPRSPLRKATEAHPLAAVLPCYQDEGRGLEAVIRKILSAQGLKASSDAFSYLMENMGTDRALTRQELEKLCLYMIPSKETKTTYPIQINLADAMACIGDAANHSVSDIVMIAAEGDLIKLNPLFDRLFGNGLAPIAALRGLSTHLLRLHFLLGSMESGKNVKQAMQSLRPRLFWKLEERVAAQTRWWNFLYLEQGTTLLRQAEIRSKSTGFSLLPICREAYLSVALLANQARYPKHGINR